MCHSNESAVSTETAGKAAGYFGMTFLARAKQTVNHVQPRRKNKDGTAGSGRAESSNWLSGYVQTNDSSSPRKRLAAFIGRKFALSKITPSHGD